MNTEHWEAQAQSAGIWQNTHTHTHGGIPVARILIQPLLSILFLLSSHLPLHLCPRPLSFTLLTPPSACPLPPSLTFTAPLWSIPLSSSPPASWMLKQEIKGWCSASSGNQKRCPGTFSAACRRPDGWRGRGKSSEGVAGEKNGGAREKRRVARGPSASCRPRSDSRWSWRVLTSLHPLAWTYIHIS